VTLQAIPIMADPHRWRGADEGAGRRSVETAVPALVGPWALNLAHPRQAVNDRLNMARQSPRQESNPRHLHYK
jgi:hypothetical protein